MEKTPAAQAYYDSMFKQYASWGVDYVKIDDMLRDFAHPNDSYYADEIEMVREAIDKSGRPMVLSLVAGRGAACAGRSSQRQRQHLADHRRFLGQLGQCLRHVYAGPRVDAAPRRRPLARQRHACRSGRIGIRGHVGD